MKVLQSVLARPEEIVLESFRGTQLVDYLEMALFVEQYFLCIEFSFIILWIT
jgi:hypothetical protein